MPTLRPLLACTALILLMSGCEDGDDRAQDDVGKQLAAKLIADN